MENNNCAVDSAVLLSDINDKVGKRPIFRNNSFDLVKILNTVYNDLYGLALSKAMNPLLLNGLIEQYRAILKFIMIYSDPKSQSIDSLDDIYEKMINMVYEFDEKYTPIRNFLDQCKNKTKSIELRDNVYCEIEHNKNDLYSRAADQMKINRGEELSNEVEIDMAKFYSKDLKNVIRDRLFISIYKKEIEYEIKASEIDFDYDFGDFKYFELINFCAGLHLICVYYTHSNILKNSNYISINRNYLITLLRYATKLSETKVEYFLNFLIYNREYQKDKLALIQPFVEDGEEMLFCPLIVKMSYLPIKLFRAIVDSNKKAFEKHISKISQIKEKEMLETLKRKFSKFDVDIVLNSMIKDSNGRNKAEYDLVIYDSKLKNLYVCECKWFSIAQGERENNNTTKKIKKFISDRINKNNVLKDNIGLFMQQYFDSSLVSNIKEFMISQNFLGNDIYDMPVIDNRELKEAFEKFDNFDNLMDYILNERFRDTINTYSKLVDVSFEGYNFRLSRIGIKTSNYQK